MIGLTLVAVGTSLPELATAIVAGLRHHSEIALGNVLGSNLFNLLLVLGVLGLIIPFQVAQEMLNFDIWVMVGAVVVLLPAVPVMPTILAEQRSRKSVISLVQGTPFSTAV